MNALGMGVPNLGAPRSIPVTSRRIVCPADVTVHANGLTMDGCDVHLRIVDMITGAVEYVPLSIGMADALSDALDVLIGAERQQLLTPLVPDAG